MSIFDKFNNQGMGDESAFEELCCQLFETWGRRQKGLDGQWTYRNIRGTGGDGGIEAYWGNEASGDFIGLQAKWFRKTISSDQYAQIKGSITTALGLRPSMKLYIVCIPHNLTSIKRGKGGAPTQGEDGAWRNFVKKIEKAHPALKLELWDEAAIFNDLQRPENEGRRRFWFNDSLINPEAIRLSLSKALASLRNRYVPELAEDGGMSVFLDNFYGTEESRATLISEIDKCVYVCHELDKAARSFIAVDNCTADDIKNSASRCQKAVSSYAHALADWRKLVVSEPDALCDIEQFDVDYASIEDFESHIKELKSNYQFHGHVDALLRLFDDFRELPAEWDLAKKVKEAFGSSYCLVIGDQGTGKTCGFAGKAHEYLNIKMHLPILIKATDVGDADTWFDVIVKTLGLSNDWSETALWQALSSNAGISDLNGERLAIRAKVAILVDGLDENPLASRWADLIRRADAITAEYPRIRFAYSSRPSGIDFERDKDLAGCRYLIDRRGDVPAWKLFDRYIDRYGINFSGHKRYKWMLRTPMELCMFCMAHKGQTVAGDVSTCMTRLVGAELDRLENEFRERCNPHAEKRSTPVRDALEALARAYLADDAPLDRSGIGKVLGDVGVDGDICGSLLDFLDDYGILAVREQSGESALASKIITYRPGSRHLWDYFMALLLVEDDDSAVANLLADHPDAIEMYGILLIEKRHVLPLDCDGFVGAIGKQRARKKTFGSLAGANPASTETFRQWALDEMRRGKVEFFDIVNEVILQVASVKDHPLGPSLLDDCLRSFPSPAARDALWSVPRNLWGSKRLAMYGERKAIKDLPQLHAEDVWAQMPLVAAWELTSVSNLRRRHFRGELIKWGSANPQEFAELFERFCDCNDPQVREDMFALAEEIVCMGNPAPEVKAKLGRAVLKSAFEAPDMPDNRDAAIRYYGRILIERCCADGVLGGDSLPKCRPPYEGRTDDAVLPVHPDACSSSKMIGYGPIHYDLARYVLVDKLESAFGLPLFVSSERSEKNEVDRIINLSASKAEVETPSFEGWVIAAAYQYLLDHGYDPDVFEGPIGEDSYRRDGIDRNIWGAFDQADHGSKSEVMTVAEKYVWCARNEIYGYLADRIPADNCSWMKDSHWDTDGRILDYGMLLNFESPLFETTVTNLREERADIIPTYPNEFSCDDGDAICDKDKLDKWIEDASPDVAFALLEHRPNVAIALTCEVVPISIFASNWDLGGKASRVWAYSGIVEPSELDKIHDARTVALDGYDNASSFITDVESTSSPVEFLSEPWIGEYDEAHEVTKEADAHIKAKPLAGDGVYSLTDLGDYQYCFPSRLAMDLCDIARTDGARFFDSGDNVVFEDVSYGEPFRREYHALLADKSVLVDALHSRGYKLIWYITVQRETNILAQERIPGFEKRIERSWLIWKDDDGQYLFRPISDKYPEPDCDFNPGKILKELLERRNGTIEVDGGCDIENAN